jgi:hypothetical protein
MTHEKVNPYKSTCQLTRTSGRIRSWLAIGLSLVAIGWGVPFVGFLSGAAMPEAFREHWIRIASLFSVFVTGLIGSLMLAMSTSYVRNLSRFRLLFLVAGWCTTLSIAGLGLVVDSQPPGSALAMFISLTGVLLFPLAIAGLAFGILGLLMLIQGHEARDE